MKTFLKPLTSEEEKYYLQEYKRGSQEAKNVLIERNLRLVAHIVKKYQGVEEELDDLISIGTIGLIKAIHTFNQENPTGSPLMLPAVSTMNCLCCFVLKRKPAKIFLFTNQSAQTVKEMKSICLM